MDAIHSGQVYFDRSTRGDETYGVGLNTFDLDFQHHVSWGEHQDFVWGLGYRVTADDVADGLIGSLNKKADDLQG